jgi:hypothetical protein
MTASYPELPDETSGLGERMPRPVPRHARPKVARFPGAAGRIPNFTGAEAAAERLRATPEWQAAGTLKANSDSAQLPVR